jgi:hypothetical protein
MYLEVANPQAYRETDDESDPASSPDYLKDRFTEERGERSKASTV